MLNLETLNYGTLPICIDKLYIDTRFVFCVNSVQLMKDFDCLIGVDSHHKFGATVLY